MPNVDYDYTQFVRGDRAHLAVQDLLRESTSSLLGVSAAARIALADVGIRTVFDLGASWLFANARAASRAASSDQPSARLGVPPNDWFQPGTVLGSLEDIGELRLEQLRGLTQGQARALEAALDVGNIRDFALWPPHAFAKQLVTGSVGANVSVDDFQTELLRPRFGDHPTERVYYSTLVMLHMDEAIEDGMIDLSGGVSLAPALNRRSGFTRPAVGALLTFSQSWYAQGTTLGHLLHSLALAPGEATRIAVLDWSRRTRSSASDDITESEALDLASQHSRSMSEVQNAVANEMQEGGSTSHTLSESKSQAKATTASTGLLTSLVASGSSSHASESATTDTSAESSSWSMGNRSVTANMAQDVNDRTEQHSTSVRNRRASAVREVSQSEHEQVSTRIIANYNHMHALTVQYYEVVQVYRVETELRKIERVLFIPFDLIEFSGDAGFDWVDRFRGVLLRVALNRRTSELLIDDTTSVEVRPVGTLAFLATFRPELAKAALSLAMRASMKASAAGTTEQKDADPKPSSSNVVIFDPSEVAAASRYVGRPIVRPGSDSLFIPDDTELISITFDGITIDSTRLDRTDVAGVEPITVVNGRVDLPPGLRFSELDSLHVRRGGESDGSGSLTFHCAYLGRRFSLPAIPIRVGTAMSKVVSFAVDQADRRRELLQLLQANRAHYSHAVLKSLDSATLVLLLSRYRLNGRPLIEQVEPKPLRVAGNFIVMRAPADYDDGSGVAVGGTEMTWQELLAQRHVIETDGGIVRMQRDGRIVPIPTNGVFAEAVLGRSNSAEKLDITRFWNWQDSPIPMQPTEIAPIETGSRAQPEGIGPGQLSPPVLNILNPTSLPDGAGIGAVLSTLATANMFRDMGGLAGTQSLAAGAASGTLRAATEAGQIASTNMANEMQKAVAMGQIAADVAKSVIGAATGTPSGSGGSSRTPSLQGAEINHGRDMDARGIPVNGTDASTPVAVAPVNGPGGVTGGEPSAGTSRGSGGNGGGSHEARAADPTIRGADTVRRITRNSEDVRSTAATGTAEAGETMTLQFDVVDHLGAPLAVYGMLYVEDADGSRFPPREVNIGRSILAGESHAQTALPRPDGPANLHLQLRLARIFLNVVSSQDLPRLGDLLDGRIRLISGSRPLNVSPRSAPLTGEEERLGELLGTGRGTVTDPELLVGPRLAERTVTVDPAVPTSRIFEITLATRDVTISRSTREQLSEALAMELEATASAPEGARIPIEIRAGISNSSETTTGTEDQVSATIRYTSGHFNFVQRSPS